MVDVSRILVAPSVTALREAVASAFEEIELEKSNLVKLGELDARISVLEAKP